MGKLPVLHSGDCRETMAAMALAGETVDAIVCDPPYDLTSIVRRFGKAGAAPAQFGRDGAFARQSKGFMGQTWDGTGVAFDPETWRLAYDVLKPGGHLVAMGGTRTYHRLVCAIEDAGFEIRDSVAWLYATGFPKSHSVSKGIDKRAGAEREIVAVGAPVKRMIPGADQNLVGWVKDNGRGYVPARTAPATLDAVVWDGWGSALKPSHEKIVIARRPFSFTQLCCAIAAQVGKALCQLSLFAKDVTEIFVLNQNGLDAGGSVFAQWNAVSACNTLADLFDLTAMWPSELAIPTSLNTGLSWLHILEDLCLHEKMFTISMKTDLITDLKILESCLSEITPATIIQAATQTHGTSQDASCVVLIFRAVELTLKTIRTRIAVENAISRHARICRGEGEAYTPAMELCVLARKPLSEATIVENVLRWGTGALNIDACRIAIPDGQWATLGRWPANVCHDGSADVLGCFPPARGQIAPSRADGTPHGNVVYGPMRHGQESMAPRDDGGSAARFFFSSKAGKADRAGSGHPTVKPVALMRWLCTLVAPVGGRVLDPFAGSGTTLQAAYEAGFEAIGCEMQPDYVVDIQNRIERMMK